MRRQAANSALKARGHYLKAHRLAAVCACRARLERAGWVWRRVRSLPPHPWLSSGGGAGEIAARAERSRGGPFMRQRSIILPFSAFVSSIGLTCVVAAQA